MRIDTLLWGSVDLRLGNLLGEFGKIVRLTNKCRLFYVFDSFHQSFDLLLKIFVSSDLLIEFNPGLV